MTLDKAKVRQLRDQLEDHLKVIEADLGFKVHVGNASYTNNSVTFKVEMASVADDGTVLNRDADAFRVNAGLFGLKPEDLGKVIRSHGKTFKITGIATRSRRCPILVEEVGTGKGYKLPAEAVKAALGVNKPHDRRPETVILRELARVECDLSPENLTCDGELPRAAVNRKLAHLNRQKQELIEELGRTPTETELNAA